MDFVLQWCSFFILLYIFLWILIVQFKAVIWFQKGLMILNLHLYHQDCIPNSQEIGTCRWNVERNELGLQEQNIDWSL